MIIASLNAGSCFFDQKGRHVVPQDIDNVSELIIPCMQSIPRGKQPTQRRSGFICYHGNPNCEGSGAYFDNINDLYLCCMEGNRTYRRFTFDQSGAQLGGCEQCP